MPTDKPNIQKPYIFISYSRHDSTKVKQIVEKLRQDEIEVWVDFDEIKDGAWLRTVTDGIENSAAVLIIVSTASKESEWVERETLLALDLRKSLFIVKIEDVTPPLHLINRHFMDEFIKDFDNGIKHLIDVVQNELKRFEQHGDSVQDDVTISTDLMKDEQNFFQIIEDSTASDSLTTIARKLYYWLHMKSRRVEFKGKSRPVMYAKIMPRHTYNEINIFSLWGYSREPSIVIPLNEIWMYPPYNDIEQRTALIQEFINSISYPPKHALTRDGSRYKIPLSILDKDNNLEQLTTIVNQMIEKIAGAETVIMTARDFDAFENELLANNDTSGGTISTESLAQFLDDEFFNRSASPLRDTLLILTYNNSQEWRFTLNHINHTAHIGRKNPESNQNPEIDVSIIGNRSKNVSRIHCRISYDIEHKLPYVTDMQSTNGTFLNGAQLAPREVRVLRNGDMLRLGALVLKVSVAEVK